MLARNKSAAGTREQDEEETAGGTEGRAESGTIRPLTQAYALKAGSLLDSILELCFEESLDNIISVSILFCSRKARQPEGSDFFIHHWQQSGTGGGLCNLGVVGSNPTRGSKIRFGM